MSDIQSKKQSVRFISLIAISGIVFSILGIGLTWYFKPRIENSVFLVIDLLDQIFTNTENGLQVLDNALEGAVGNLDTISSTLFNLNTTIDGISDSLGSSADLIGGDLRNTIIDTQTALSSASTSALLVDNTLRIIAAIPIIGGDYRPEVPLSVSLLQVSESLSDVPEAFLDIQQYIQDTQVGMVGLKSDITQLSKEIESYEQDLLAAQRILTEYDLVIDELREQLADLRQNISGFLFIVSLLMTGGFFFLGIGQASLFKQSFDNQKNKQVTVNLANLQRD